MGKVVAVFMVGFCLMVVGAISTENKERDNRRYIESLTPAQRLAIIDRTSNEARLQQSITRLSQAFGESEDLVASKLVKTQELMANKGVHERLDSIAAGAESTIPEATQLGVSLSEILASAVTLVRP